MVLRKFYGPNSVFAIFYVLGVTNTTRYVSGRASKVWTPVGIWRKNLINAKMSAMEDPEELQGRHEIYCGCLCDHNR
jgi:hypothetical protein